MSSAVKAVCCPLKPSSSVKAADCPFLEDLSLRRKISVRTTPTQKQKPPYAKAQSGYTKQKASTTLFSRDVSIQVSSALLSLTTVFGMGTGGT